MEFTEKLFQALKNDNIKEFKDCMDTTNCGPLRLGRFPVLSVMYLYKARKLLRAYEKRFLKHNSWQDVGEPMELGAKFRSVAGKCLRIYLNETVSPVEMLLLLNKDTHVKKVFSQAHVTPPVKQRLGNIYYIKWGLKANFVRNTVVLERRPLTQAEKMQWLLRAVCILLCLALIVSMPFVVNAISPYIVDGDGVLNVTKWWQIKFNSDKTYVLQKDVTVSPKFFATEMNCKINGNGHTVTVTGGSLFGTVNGEISDVIFNTNGSPLAENVALNAQIDNVTVNATVDMQTDTPIGFVANNNYGNIINTVVNASGTLTAVAPEQTTEEEEPTEPESFNCGGIVAVNDTTRVGDRVYGASLHNCVANFDNFRLQGQSQVDSAFGGIVGQNNAFVEGCQTSGSLSADTFDVAGICAENTYDITDCVNKANVSQRTDVVTWSPLVAGIAMLNLAPGGVIEGCVNEGDISAECPTQVRIGGIAGMSSGDLFVCLSVGKVQATGVICYVGGIVGLLQGADTHEKLYLGQVVNSIATCEINVTMLEDDDNFATVGGIVGLAQQWSVHGDTHEIIYYTTGNIVYDYFIGEIHVNNGVHAGAIVGAVGQKVYDVSENETNENRKFFYGNSYADNCGVGFAFGSVFDANDNFTPVTDIGATKASVAEIQNDARYKEILEALGITNL